MSKQAILKLLSRKHGATIEALVQRFHAEPKQVRNCIDNLRRAGYRIENTAPHRFKAF